MTKVFISKVTSVVWPISQAFKGVNHPGVDLAMPKMTPILAPGTGKVIVSALSKSAGEWIVIHFPKRDIYLTLMHLTTREVKVGDRVKAAQVIGYSGNTGRVSKSGDGLHLHLEVRKRYNDGVNTLDPNLYFDFAS